MKDVQLSFMGYDSCEGSQDLLLMRLYVFACSASVEISVKLPTDFKSSKTKVIILHFCPRSTTALFTFLSPTIEWPGQMHAVQRPLCHLHWHPRAGAAHNHKWHCPENPTCPSSSCRINPGCQTIQDSNVRLLSEPKLSTQPPSCCLLLYPHSRVFLECHSSNLREDAKEKVHIFFPHHSLRRCNASLNDCVTARLSQWLSWQIRNEPTFLLRRVF